jgi:hypothetical protein
MSVTSSLRHSLVAGLASLGLAAVASAHQPYLTTSRVTPVTNPDVSQAFYAELKGQPDEYRFSLAEPLLLYLNVLVPDIPGAHPDYSAELRLKTTSGDSLVRVLDGAGSHWTVFHEPFANDNYLQGPELRERMPPGDYLVRVSSPGNQGKYVLAIGERESFPPAEIARVIGVMPSLKRYFGKSAWTAYFNYTGLFIGATAVVAAGIVVLGVSLARR